MLGPAIFASVFAFFIGPDHPFELPGAPFLLSAGLIGLAWLLAARVTRPSDSRPRDAAPSTSPADAAHPSETHAPTP